MTYTNDSSNPLRTFLLLFTEDTMLPAVVTDIVANANTLDNVCDVTKYYMFLFLAITNTHRMLQTSPPDGLLSNNGPVLHTFLQQHDKKRQLPTCPL
jgi:hypothetical protein